MASFFYNNAVEQIVAGTLGMTGLKVMLIKSSYTPANHNDTTVAQNLTANEIVATNYTGGFGGSGRLALTSTTSTNNSLPGAQVVFANVTWPSVGGATNDVIGGVAVIHEAGSADSTAIPVAFLSVASTPTNGSSIQLSFDQTNGNFQFTT